MTVKNKKIVKKNSKPALNKSIYCPCGSGKLYVECCGLLHNEVRLPMSAEEVLRSRFSAFVKGEGQYLLDTWDPATKPNITAAEALGDSGKSVKYTKLEINNISNEGKVSYIDYIARYRVGTSFRAIDEKAKFTEINGSWFYTSGVVNDLENK